MRIKVPPLLRSLSGGLLLSLAFYVVLLPSQPIGLPITLGMMLAGLFWLLSGRFRLKYERLRSNGPAGALFFFFLVSLIGSFYSAAPGKAEADLLRQIPFVVWPLILGSTLLDPGRWLFSIMRLLVLATLATLLVGIAGSTFYYLAFPHSDLFFFQNLTDLGRVPPHYLALFTNFSYGLTLSWLLRQEKPFKQLLPLFILIAFLVFLVLLSVRIQFFIFALINLYLLGKYWAFHSGPWMSALRLTGLLAFFLSLVFLFPGSRERMMDTFHELRSLEEMVDNKQTNHRIYLWDSSLAVLADSWLWGTGTGAENGALQRDLQKVDAQFWDGTTTYRLHEQGYNYHNTYLQRWAAQGLPGLLSLVFLFVVPLWSQRRAELPGSLRQAQFLFLLACGWSFATESMLQRQAGILFFSFFYAVLFCFPHETRELPQKRERKG